MRILEYDVAIMRYDVEGKLKGKKGVQAPIKLPVIYNFVVYTGKEKWGCPTRLLDAFEAPEIFYRMFEDDFLVALNAEGKDKIMGDGEATTAELFLKEGWRKDLCGFLDKNEWLAQKINDSLYGKEIILYVLDRDPHNVDEVLQKLPNLDPKLKNDIMSGLQRMKEASVQQGLEKGVQQGLEKGIKAIQDFFKEGIITKEQADNKIKDLKQKSSDA